ncbi:hypothetical protein [Martelella sp. HB161492]|uniref:hypothetical protein n=1 Tax=Martelella sp. HB161492 TaxID=2720726 RepID=UPI0015918158|nr:hypothetical protein [Martelella sp. HB161492]
MLSAHIDIDLSRFEAKMTSVQRELLPKAEVLALNWLAYDAMREVKARMKTVFDRPTPYAVRGIVYDNATLANRNSAVVATGDRTKGGLPATAFLGPEIEGGMRGHKAFEQQLIGRGLMRRNEVAVPARQTPLDRYGNMTQGFLNRVMRDLKIDYRGSGTTRVSKDSKRRKRKAKAYQFFVPEGRSDLARGIWFSGRAPDRGFYPVILFVTATAYTERLKLNEIVAEVVRAKMDRTFERAFRKTFAKH